MKFLKHKKIKKIVFLILALVLALEIEICYANINKINIYHNHIKVIYYSLNFRPKRKQVLSKLIGNPSQTI